MYQRSTSKLVTEIYYLPVNIICLCTYITKIFYLPVKVKMENNNSEMMGSMYEKKCRREFNRYLRGIFIFCVFNSRFSCRTDFYNLIIFGSNFGVVEKNICSLTTFEKKC